MKNIILIFLGGGLGSLFRFWTSSSIQRLGLFSFLPFGTLFVNVLGCFIIGLLSSLVKDNQLRYLLITGFCGGFTTFSTFSSENIHLFQTNQTGIAILYTVLSIFLGLLGVSLGILISQMVK